jgi:hypothetical protein
MQKRKRLRFLSGTVKKTTDYHIQAHESHRPHINKPFIFSKNFSSWRPYGLAHNLQYEPQSEHLLDLFLVPEWKPWGEPF